MERLEAFESMLADLIGQYERETKEMERLKAAGKEKTATYRQYLGNRLVYTAMLARYRAYGLLNEGA